MGNEQSHLSGIDIEDKAVEISDFWSQHSASFKNFDNKSIVTLFVGEIFINGPLWTVHTPLEKCSKNLMLYRHPCILKYISSWQKNSKYYLAVENVKPLSQILGSLSTLQVSVGLFSILKSLCFLHEKASVSHNNLCTSSIYVTSDGSWKLGGMEFLCKYEELKPEYLNKIKPYRYNKSQDSKEDDLIRKSNTPKEFVDAYAFFNLVSEVLKAELVDSEIPSVKSFLLLCKNSLMANLEDRPKLMDLLTHDFFHHEFILIYSFLEELPLKSEDEKTSFFTNLSSRLIQFNESLVAAQLGSLLLSRMVLINKVAQDHLIPLILCFRTASEDSSNSMALFNEPTFKKYIVPKLLEIFCVRDAQIRLILLKHFCSYVYAFSEEELQSYILPELLVGIKDTNDHLVSVTLKALADLVPILGASIVIGGKRAKLFTDGRPTSARKSRTCPKTTNNFPLNQTDLINSDILNTNVDIEQSELSSFRELPERQRPDGEEVEDSTDEIEPSVEEELEWEEWGNENDENNQCLQENRSIGVTTENEIVSVDNGNLTNDEIQDLVEPEIDISLISTIQKLSHPRKNNTIQDINHLDIKNQRNKDNQDDIDFFGDMEPTIESSQKFVIDTILDKNINNTLSKLELKEQGEDDGWVEEDWE